MAGYSPGTRVKSIDWGWGIVLSHAAHDKLVYKPDSLGIELEIALTSIVESEDKLEGRSPEQDQTSNGVGLGFATGASPGEVMTGFPKRKAIEALRFGLVPHDYIEELTMGYEPLADWAQACLEAGGGKHPTMHCINGPFGTGKSHTMSVVRHVAWKNNYLTAHIEVDGQMISLANPDHFLFNLWHNLRGSDFESECPLLDLYIGALEQGHSIAPPPLGLNQLVANNFEAIKHLHKKQLIDQYALLLESVLSSSDEYTSALIKREMSEESEAKKVSQLISLMKSQNSSRRPAALVLSLSAHAIIARAAGYAGLAVLIDEFEVEYNQTPANLRNLQAVLDEVNVYLSGDSHYPRAPLTMFVATVAQGESGVDDRIDRIVSSSGGRTYQLRPWQQAQRAELSRRIFKIYRDVYPINQDYDPLLPDRVENMLNQRGFENNDGFIRAFIKWYVALLDRKWGPPEVIYE